ncbi:hypothetical protein [Levilactobacillus angrenensis]|uniref:Uncharacterized protein n=1 Tax=Levilactobacillus angrenensis TaxID=2486020 RepID=A0ABW1U7A1_9LACO|nr:hypothetical protein [Levilactobacillus angrenensis]
MISLWLQSDDGNIVDYLYQAEEGKKGHVLWSRKHHGLKFLDNYIDGYPKSFREGINMVLDEMSKKDDFPEYKIIPFF